MTSKINPTNVNGSFPLIGVSNDSQGFRNNFTNTSTNLKFAKEEIEDLQTRGVFVSSANGRATNNDMLGSTISNTYLAAVSDLVKEHNLIAGVVVVNFNDGSYHTISTNGPIALDTKWGNLNNQTLSYGVMRIEVDITDITHTIQFPVEVNNSTQIIGYEASVGLFSAPNVGKYIFTLGTINGGATIALEQSMINPAIASASIVFVKGVVSAPPDSRQQYIVDVDDDVTGILLAGREYDYKMFVIDNLTANKTLIVTVPNAGWVVGVGTMSFSTLGATCSLQFIKGKWFCTGNNGVVFA